MTFRQRIWACTAVAVASGLMASGLGRWSAQAVFAGCALWLLCGLFLGEVAHGALNLGRLWRHAGRIEQANVEPPLPYAQANSPSARLRLAVSHRQSEGHAASPAQSLALALVAAALALALAGLFAQRVELIVSIALALALALGILTSTETAITTVLTMAAWCGGLAALRAIEMRTALAGMFAALLLGACTHPSPNRAWRIICVACGLSLGATLALARQPALAGLLMVSTLAGLATPSDQPQPLGLQLATAAGVLLAGLAVGHWG